MIKDQSDSEIAEMVTVNLVSIAMVLERLVHINGLRTVLMSSISGKVGSYDPLYAATKAGVDLLLRSYAPKLSADSRLNAISPGIISDAKMTTIRTDFNVMKEKIGITPTQEFCTSEEIARLSHYLLFEARNMTGENVNVNGGLYVG